MTRAIQTQMETTTTSNELEIELTKDTYNRAKRAINRSANRVEEAVEGADEKTLLVLEKNLAMHNKMLDNLMKLTGGLNAGQPESKTVEIDLDAARSEIVERLSRIRSAS